MLNDEIEIPKDCYAVYIPNVDHVKVNVIKDDVEYIDTMITSDFVTIRPVTFFDIVLSTQKYVVYNPNSIGKMSKSDEDLECIILLHPKQDSHI